MKHTHILKLPRRMATVTIEEFSDRVQVNLQLDRYGDYGDIPEFRRLFLPLLERYDSDPRPTVMDHPLTGERATIIGNAAGSMVVISRGTKGPS